MEKLHRPLAPLASSETFSDGVSILHEERHKKKSSMHNGSSYLDKKADQMSRNNDFDSLEILFDFPSTDLFTDSQADIKRSPSPCRIRFSENTEIINSNKVLHLLTFSFF